VYIRGVRAYVEMVDTLQDFPLENPRTAMGISEGPITNMQIQTSMKGGKKITDTSFQMIGGHETEFLYSYKGDTLFPIIYSDNVPKNIYATYYYRNDTLIYGQVRLEDNTSNFKMLYQGAEYYRNGKICYSERPPINLPDELQGQLHFNWYQKGIEYLHQYQKMME
jgi:hypothetical protein